jgi:hypothetical protein
MPSSISTLTPFALSFSKGLKPHICNAQAEGAQEADAAYEQVARPKISWERKRKIKEREILTMKFLGKERRLRSKSK